MSEPSEAPWTVTYHDGSNNGFRFARESAASAVSFSYSPMTPERSSSGTYSGGEPKQGQLTAAQTEELWRWVERLEAEAPPPAAPRTMGTGTLRVKVSDEARRVLVKRGATSRELEQFLKPFRGAPDAQ